MEKSMKIESIISEIKQLDYDTRVSLMERLYRILKKDIQKSKHSIHLTELNGLGAEIWTNVNIDRYVQQERQWD